MKKIASILVAGCVLAGLQALPAQADTSSSSTPSNRWEIRVGAMDVNGTDIQNNTQASVGIEYEFQDTSNGGGTLSLSADFVQITYFVPVIQNNFVFAGTNTATTVPVLLNYKWYSTGNPNRYFGGVGLGSFLGNFNGFAYTGFVGYQFSNNWDVTVRYIGDSGSSYSGATLSSVFGADLGYKF